MNQPRYWSRIFLTGAMSLAAVTFAGCTSHGRDAVPSEARTLTTGDGRGVVSATAPHDGKMYILDETDNTLVWSGAVRRDDRVTVDGDARAIKRNGETVSDAHVHRDHRYKIQFDRSDNDRM